VVRPMGSFRGMCVFSVVAVMPQLVTSLVATPSFLSAPGFVAQSTVKMQYGGQQGYDQQQGYNAQQGYGNAQQSYGQQQGGFAGSSGGSWLIYAAAGVQGHNMFSGAVTPINRDRFGSICEKYGQLPYRLLCDRGDKRTLGRHNMQFQVPTVSRSQCKVSVTADGMAYLTSTGTCANTLWRMPNGQWNELYADQTQMLQSGVQIGLDVTNPEGTVFTLQYEPAGMQQGGDQAYGQQQQGFGQQQGGYPQQGGYAQQGGGYGY